MIFMKKNVHYAFVGKMVEKELSKHFKKPMLVATRDISSLNKCIKSAEGGEIICVDPILS